MIPLQVPRVWRMSLLTAVEKTIGCRPVAARLSIALTTVLAWSTVVMKGIVMRSNSFSGNCVSKVLPSVSAVMPVLSERK